MQSIKKIIHHLFIPHEGNNYRAKALHIDFLTYYLLFALFLSFGFKTLYARSGDVLGFATDITVDKLYQLTNNLRLDNQLPPLESNEHLALAAQKKASDMFAKNYWSHYSPDGLTPWDFILDSGYRYEFAGENLAKNFLFGQGVIDAWMNSSSHRDNILRKEYTEVGFAVVNGILNGEETTLVVQLFGKPLTTPLAQVSQNLAEKELAPITEEVDASIPIVEKNPLIQKQPAILAQKTSPEIKNTTQLIFNSNLIFLSFLILAIILDLYFATKLRIIRVSGKSLAHLIFISFIFIGLLILTKGSVL
ncbi:hypothetical protein A3C98_02115 [Candidatus Roizmanbacteria bacterium RIFCSPHIGHO2_02_FULL_37_15]|uniref:SCP domain-containing protein n=1 Tax=Candidatus Roizmanbacteria bacterium RIFCSPLOWO2_01_FULL_37_16 TaxID=1802058 RepID=A0A1F7IQC4_9BACT|nr:MAG: hypothetical protein A2859_04475 [Candidatus Roizmanbacteria bacterium RIFCSPHIGHO2_01_FULL_37_16b]OGK21189.1 MAG: hypothetical protein A3C98_02115 [Candidatus Roizmanbacteria bacterium RIFCSPHIGHO2_02_FULL_37_15]OGK32872.1 MAG: hypothetical protein A3F57_01970 [Candidatus Roizmanbacteria bacterium RIFCSPHIGHO2_12_FULL_36_11]OGK45512.1 MAG: hypothetical protein A3B40_00655 [Candidatus Roizmanbacteria bacterium RIFCSPLOWO2_01_FULL_37_16]OGK55716.1 MAG: hypothetical protein A3I50_02550 [C